jgi:hypothetical protein
MSPSRFRRSPRRRLAVALLGLAAVAAVGVVSTAGAATRSGGGPGAAAAGYSTDRHPGHRPGHGHRPTGSATPTTTAPTSGAPSASTSTSATASATASSMPGMPGMATPPVTDPILVDPAQQAQDTKDFFARTPAPVNAGNPRTASEFQAHCTGFHMNDDDPIVFPNMPGASHNHTFWGNTTTKADSTLTSLSAGTTTCEPKEDKSAYWIPTLLQNGQKINPQEVTVYYGTNLKDYSKIQPFPKGLRMVVGDPKQQTGEGGSRFFCPGGDTGRKSADGMWPVCEKGPLVRYILFPECWDGVHLDVPGHKSHMAFGIGGGVCPADHPVQLPTLVYVLSYPESLAKSPEGITLSSGTVYSMHADFFNAWDEDALAQRVRDCLNQHVKCNAAGQM